MEQFLNTVGVRAADASNANSTQDVWIIMRHKGLLFAHKPSGMSVHPHPLHNQLVRSSGPLVCPCCGRGFGKDEAFAWKSLYAHLLQRSDASHVAWRAANPGGIAREVTTERTVWHVLRDWPRLWDAVSHDKTAAITPPAASLLHPAASSCSHVSAATLSDGPEALSERLVHLINRLDRGTSGIVCVAETAELKAACQRSWEQATKTYLVMVRGRTADAFKVERPLTDSSTRLKTSPQREAVTAFELVCARLGCAASRVACAYPPVRPSCQLQRCRHWHGAVGLATTPIAAYCRRCLPLPATSAVLSPP